MTTRDRAMAALQIVGKWRTLFAGWQLGTRLKGDPECDAVRDHREVTILLRVESSAIVGVLLRKGVITEEEWLRALEQEAHQLSDDYARRFPGITAHEWGLNLELPAAAETMRGWKP